LSTVRKVLPAVVSVVSEKHLSNFEKNPHTLYSFVPGHEKVAVKKNNKKDLQEAITGSGSGFIVDRSGLILTNKHILGDVNTEYTVILDDGRKFKAEILSTDPLNDVAVLKIKADNLHVIELGDASRAELGEIVLAIGNALGAFKNTVSLGIVSGLSRSVSAKENPKGPLHEMRGLIQTDAAINPGNSGGPLVNLKGKVIGINVATVSNAHSIGLAIPINAARRDLADIRKFGRIRRLYLGVRYLIIDEYLKNKLNLPVDYGALVTSEHMGVPAVLPGSPAAKAGIMEKDIILECDGKKICSENVLEDYLSYASDKKGFNVLILRANKKIGARIVPAERD